jgi:hypothetical protein
MILILVFVVALATGGMAMADSGDDIWPWWDSYFYDPTPPRAGVIYPGVPYTNASGLPYYQGYGPPYFQGYGPPYTNIYANPYGYPAVTTVPYSYYGY